MVWWQILIILFLVISILAVLGTLVYLGVPAVISFLGDIGVFVKKPRQGRFIAIMRGGTYKDVIYSIEGWKMNSEGKMVRGEEENPSWLRRRFGVEWIGVPFINTVFTFPLKGDEYGKMEGQSGQSIVQFSEKGTETLFFQHTYAFILKEAETRGNVPLNVEAQITLRRLYPERCFFKLGTPQKGLDTVIGLVLSEAREKIQGLSVDEILGLGDEGVDSSQTTNAQELVKTQVLDAIKKLNTHTDISELVDMDEEDQDLRGHLSTLTGYEIIAVAIEEVEPALPADEIKKLRAPALARKEAQETINKAEGDAKAVRIKADANRYSLQQDGEGRAEALSAEAKIMTRTKHGADLRRLQAVENSNLVTPGGDGGGMNLLIQPEKKDKKKKETEEE